MAGIDVLNTGYGNFELRFNPNSPQEVQKAKETITDMLKRGYAIFVRKGTETFRVRKFDPDKSVYIISHLLMMRGSEEKFWANANQHPLDHPAAGM